MFYLGSLALFGLAASFLWRASPYSESGCYAYEKNRKFRIVGQILLIMAIFALGIAVLSQFYSSHS